MRRDLEATAIGVLLALAIVGIIALVVASQ